MLEVEDALEICRAVAAQSGEDLDLHQVLIAAAVERLLFELVMAQTEAARYREQLTTWGIPAKRMKLKRLESGGFEKGWED